jgi:hypothetical protein
MGLEREDLIDGLGEPAGAATAPGPRHERFHERAPAATRQLDFAVCSPAIIGMRCEGNC